MKYKHFCVFKSELDCNTIYPTETTAEEGIDVLKSTFIDDDWFVAYPASKGQMITEVVGEIIRRYEQESLWHFIRRRYLSWI
jgi:hypothetical protein